MYSTVYSIIYSILYITAYVTVYVILSITISRRHRGGRGAQRVEFVEEYANYFKVCIHYYVQNNLHCTV